MNQKNIDLLKQNGMVIFLDVPLKVLMEIPPKGRPLLENPDNLIKLYNDRYTLYDKLCDIKVVKNGFNTAKTMHKIEVKINEYINS